MNKYMKSHNTNTKMLMIRHFTSSIATCDNQQQHHEIGIHEVYKHDPSIGNIILTYTILYRW
jgi:hypothetical protein